MSLVLPSELVVDRLLPTLRSMLAVRLADRGLTQREIATHLGVTQAAVSKYVGGEAGGDERFREDPETVAAADRIAAGIAEGEMDGYDALAEVLSLIDALVDRGPLCTLHEEEMPVLEGLGCDLCVRGSDETVQAEREALADVRTAARTVATTPGLAEYVPNVGTNVGTALPEAADATEVAAIPGRIYVVGGRIEVPANPEFGASRNVATAVIAASAVDPAVRGAVNLVTDDALLAAARELGVDAVEFDPDYENRADRLRDRFEAEDGVPRLAYHRGAFGVEPITYVFGTTGLEAARFLRELVAATSPSDRSD